ncbi:ABC transporter substrate-binding protein [Halosolutus gelatinilyticus]|uniref:ABC transporter substrate-binding protein n=1 Tax=Halosolutus gelatinilyticus TaxID=2931975 RepID=UPI001FF340FB|nr:ABC transporter substrate-binding protein [Halosolutus gelatinilyticus]
MVSSDNPSRRAVLKRTGAGATGIVAMASLSGCTGGGNGDDGDGGDGTNNPDPDEVDENAVRVGYLHPFTGPFAALGDAQDMGSEVAVNHVNNDLGGILDREVVRFVEDTEGDPGQGRDMARRHVKTNEVDVLIGGVSGAVNLSISDYAADAGVPYFAYGGPEELTGSECRPTTFRYQYSDAQIARTGAAWSIENLGENVWIHIADYAFGQSIRREWKRAFEASGMDYTIVNETQTPLGHDDFSATLSEIQASDADWVLQGFSGSDAVNFLSQAEQFGLQQDIMSTTNTYLPLRQGAGSSAVDTYTTIRYDPAYDSEANQTLVDQYTNTHDEPPTDHALVMWTSLRLYAQAADEAGSLETAAIVSALEGLESDEPMGSTTLRECDHQALRDGFIGRITEPDQYDWPGQEIVAERPAEEITRDCGETGCEMPSL